MGGAASIDAALAEHLDYESLRSNGLDFVKAHQAIHKQAKLKTKSSAHNDMQFLAVRQLSQTLKKNQEEINKKKVLKSRSLPSSVYKKLKENKQLRSAHLPLSEIESLREEKEEKDEKDIDERHEELREQLDNNIVEEVIDKKKKKKKPPALLLRVDSDAESVHIVENDPNAFRNDKVVIDRPSSPSQQARVSPRGTLHMGKYKVMETGIMPSNGSFKIGTSFNSGKMDNHNNSSYQMPRLPALGGKRDFIEIGKLGSGASGVVTEAIHVPSLTLVALKMLPVYNQQKRQHVSRELAVLYKNLADLRLVNDKLSESTRELYGGREYGLSGSFANRPGDNSLSNDHTNTTTNNNCPNILSLYNAFVDPKTGMINLVIEYMDGGSLEDLVGLGGCRDEWLLADIAKQTLNGLKFLHKNKNVHRDIKPANILCSSSGTVKIADFGISKALDKTSGFANSFVGTVCYMSPERITGESYSFPCDIWSFGLTLLAVAEGRFPLSTKEDGSDGLQKSNESTQESEPQQDKIIGGAGGYWAMIKAICDDEPPSPNRKLFSPSFIKFISYCLQKNPTDRLTAAELLETDFILSCTTNNNLESKINGHSNGTTIHGNVDKNGKSLLSARLTTAAVVRRGSQDYSNAANSVELVHTLSASDFKENDNVSNFSIDDKVDDDDNDGNHSENNLINAIRLEHLDRVLARMFKKAHGKNKQYSSSGCTINEITEGDDDDNDNDYDDDDDDEEANESDFDDIHHFQLNDADDVNNTKSTEDSFDDLLQRNYDTKNDHNDSKNSNLLSPTKLLKTASAQSILKNNRSYANSFIEVSDPYNTTNTTIIDENKAKFATKHYDSNTSNSIRSVHFFEKETSFVIDSNESKQGKTIELSKIAKAKMKLQALQVDDDVKYDDPAIEQTVDDIESTLPRSSSYFMSTNDNTSAIKPVRTAIPTIDYRAMIPKLNKKGIPKWENLANQLNLPTNVVILAAKSKLGKVMDILEGSY